jgi:hypothetical protein
MKKISAILLTTTYILSASAAFADVASIDDPFFWIEGQNGAPSQTEIVGNGANGDMQRGEFTSMNNPHEEDYGAKGSPYAPNPVVEDYPAERVSQYGTPEQGQAQYITDDCSYPARTPTTMVFSTPNRMKTGERGMTPYDTRRGEENGDDGILSAIQDNPCADIMRRGGETADSARGHLRKGDIRRANTLEDRRIPTHSVGRYSPEGSGLWYRDPSNPFIDSSSEWEVRQGETLSQLLHRWGDDAGFTIVYQADTDYVLQANVVIRGTFSEASGQVIESFASATPPITADFFLGNKVIVVRSASDFDAR